MSHHGPDHVLHQFPENVIHKPDIKIIEGRTIYFEDGSDVNVDAILYCTGRIFLVCLKQLEMRKENL